MYGCLSELLRNDLQIHEELSLFFTIIFSSECSQLIPVEVHYLNK